MVAGSPVGSVAPQCCSRQGLCELKHQPRPTTAVESSGELTQELALLAPGPSGFVVGVP